MATPMSIRPSIARIVNAAKVLPGANATVGPILPAACQKCSFSSTPEYNNRRSRRDNNRLRGLSSLYRSGTRFRMNIDKSELPEPANYKPKIKVDPNHGLWDFFYAKGKLLLKPDETSEHGRAWTVEELRHKSWEDLHKLWWVCVKEQNRLSTAHKERIRLNFPLGDEEEGKRLAQVRKTMRSIRHALTERWYLWEDARKLAESDPEINLNNRQKPYMPREYTPSDYSEAYEDAPEGSDQDQLAPQTPSGFMTEQPATTKPDDVDPSAIPKTPETPAEVKP